MRDGFISMGHGRALINIEDTNDQLNIYEKIVSNNLSVRDTEAIVRSYKTQEGKIPSTKKVSPLLLKKQKRNLLPY